MHLRNCQSSKISCTATFHCVPSCNFSSLRDLLRTRPVCTANATWPTRRHNSSKICIVTTFHTTHAALIIPCGAMHDITIPPDVSSRVNHFCAPLWSGRFVQTFPLFVLLCQHRLCYTNLYYLTCFRNLPDLPTPQRFHPLPLPDSPI